MLAGIPMFDPATQGLAPVPAATITTLFKEHFRALETVTTEPGRTHVVVRLVPFVGWEAEHARLLAELAAVPGLILTNEVIAEVPPMDPVVQLSAAYAVLV